ncbi:FxsA family protein [Rubripirellula lacrimiformis]|nr:FxsA family protein [Rubripirellula lacrimiformis]
MLIRLFVLFVLIPLIELYLLLQLAEATSLATTLLIVIVTGVFGSFLARREGAMAWFRFQSAMAEGRMPSREIQDGLMIVFAAALLLTPGIITDAVGFMLLLPAGRNVFRKLFLSRFSAKFQTSSTSATGHQTQSYTWSSGSPISGSPLDGSPLNGSPLNGPQSGEKLHRNPRGYTIDAEAVERKSP